MLTELEKKVIAAIQGDMPVVEEPFAQIGAEIGVDEDALLEVLIDLARRGVIRRFGATLRHQKSGFLANVMAAWQVDEDRLDEVGEIMASFKEVSHCYRRNPTPEWNYNLYTMIHGKSEEHCRETAESMAAKAGVGSYAMLFSRREFKKTSMKYFNNHGS